jgi:hypothetical protein
VVDMPHIRGLSCGCHTALWALGHARASRWHGHGHAARFAYSCIIKGREKIEKNCNIFLQHKDSLSRVHPAEFVSRLIYSLVLAIINPCDLTIGIRVVSVLGEPCLIRGLVLQPASSAAGGLRHAGRDAGRTWRQ